ncbi:ABC transporter ATP-binding protein [Microbacterium pygmaeum]|uniref:Multidrug/hemolysin transport system ATP-binding protein n=1 Tax=Microbacterium pygmaeum TaxID=370764 RepID=A0A1G8BV50_9MICO|nr:ABC transporter ATP-binding protein [Microbacterium pygmaeum]SDH37042.1 multidrug/hemolysin transport system ATP-binding protein [Microbacterium pygmaeum]
MAIDVEGLTKRYRAVTAVDDLSFSVPDGVAFAFLGANGAGKSTTINCLTTVLPFDAGSVRVAGHDVIRDGERVRGRIGVVFQDSVLDPMLTVRENLRLRATIARVSRKRADTRIAELAEMISLGAFLDRRYGKLSGGQRRRVDIARALVHEPDIIFLDEPTAGLDPASRAVVWSTIHGLREQTGLTVFLTTHYMEETEEVDRVCIIDRGRIVADGTPADLRAAHSTSVLTITSADPAALLRLAQRLGGSARTAGEQVVIDVGDAELARLILAEHGTLVRDFEFRHGRMDDVFLALTGRSGEDATAAEGERVGP